jgi:peptidoglycan/LPS O-acetylase OafA/YrhL
VIALGGLAVLLVVLQGSGGFTVELLGADLLLAVAGFRVTHALLETAVTDGRAPLRAWYGQQLGHRVALLALVLGAVLLAAAAGRPEPAAQAGLGALVGLPGGGNWWSLAERTGLLDAHGLPRDWYADRPGTVDPLGALWLVGLLVQLGVVWPLVLVALRRLLGVRARREALTRLLPVLVVLTYLAWLIGPLRTAAGAPAAELALGTHVRAAEFLLGAVAAVAVVGLHGRRIPRWVAPALAAAGVAGLVALAVLASRYPVEWLRLGGPSGAAAAGALLLLAARLPAHGPLAGALGRGLPLELGRAAYPLLLLHLPAFWLVQRGVPTVRPAALLLTGTRAGLAGRPAPAGRAPAAVAGALAAVGVGPPGRAGRGRGRRRRSGAGPARHRRAPAAARPAARRPPGGARARRLHRRRPGRRAGLRGQRLRGPRRHPTRLRPAADRCPGARAGPGERLGPAARPAQRPCAGMGRALARGGRRARPGGGGAGPGRRRRAGPRPGLRADPVRARLPHPLPAAGRRRGARARHRPRGGPRCCSPTPARAPARPAAWTRSSPTPSRRTRRSFRSTWRL